MGRSRIMKFLICRPTLRQILIGGTIKESKPCLVGWTISLEEMTNVYKILVGIILKIQA
jgi:hypothetical protein